MKRRIFKLSALFLLSVIFMFKGWTFLGILLMVGAGKKVVDFYQDPYRTIKQEIWEKEEQLKLQVPKDPIVQGLLLDVYKKKTLIGERFPALRSELENVFDEFWYGVVSCEKSQEWEHSLRILKSNLPVSSAQATSEIRKKLDTFQKSYHLIEKSRDEIEGLDQINFSHSRC